MDWRGVTFFKGQTLHNVPELLFYAIYLCIQVCFLANCVKAKGTGDLFWIRQKRSKGPATAGDTSIFESRYWYFSYVWSISVDFPWFDSATDTQKIENFDSDSDTDTKVKQVF